MTTAVARAAGSARRVRSKGTGGPWGLRLDAVRASDPRIERTMWMSIYEGAFTMTFLLWTSGAVLTGYLIHYNATPMQLALAGCLPLLAQLLAPLAAWLLSVYPRGKVLTVVLALLGRSLWLLPPIAAGVLVPVESLPSFVLVILLVSFIFQHMAGTIWTTWMGKVVPEDVRGSYFGFRTGVLAVVGLVASLAVGAWLDVMPQPYGFQSALVVAVLFAFAGIWAYTTHWEPPRTEPSLRIREIFTIPLRDGNFRRFLLLVCYWQMSVMLAASFFYPYLIDHLELPYIHIAIFQAIAAVTSLVAGSLWGRLADRVGNKTVLRITMFLAGGLLPLTWILCTPGNVTMVYISGFVDGLAWSAVNPALFNMTIASAPADRRVAYVGISTMLVGVAGFAGGLLSAILLEAYAPLRVSALGIDWTAYHWLFLTSLLFRVQALWLLAPVREKRARRLRDLLRTAFSQRWSGFFWR